MDLALGPQLQEFQAQVRSWFAANSNGPAPVGFDRAFEWHREWQRRLHRDGLAGLTWPTEYGGRGGTLLEQAVFNEEAAKVGALRPFNFVGLNLVGPSIMRHGSEWHKQRFLAPILAADEFWCQGFSEPEAGSDLASLKTRAVRESGGWRVSGQKVWTSQAHRADWCILLARSDPSSSRHRGLTYCLMDMHQPGIELRRLRQASGEDEFNEMFLDGAFIPDENVVGEVGDGWAVAMTTLMHERAGLSFSYSLELRQDLEMLVQACRDRGLLQDAEVRSALAELSIEADALRINGLRALSRQASGRPLGPEASLGKLHWAQTSQRLAALALDVLGPEALVAEDNIWSFAFIRSRSDTIKGGTSEIQANIIAERVLGLPRMTI